MNCHDASTPGLVMGGPNAAYSAGDLDLDFLFSLTQAISVPDPCDEPPAVVDFNTDVQPIFSTNCSCHLGAGGSEGLDLSNGMAYSELVGEASTQVPGMDRVTAGDTANSYLWHKLNGTQAVGSQMPASGPPYLGVGDLAIIEQWILDGANP